jgi:hypothetical protein
MYRRDVRDPEEIVHHLPPAISVGSAASGTIQNQLITLPTRATVTLRGAAAIAAQAGYAQAKRKD